MPRDERSAGFMADAYARFTNRPGVFECPSGAGAMYSLPPVAESNGSSVPDLPRDCETARTIARQLISSYQKGIRDSGALKYIIGFDKRSVSGTDADTPEQGSEESAQEIADGMNSPISPDDLDMLSALSTVCASVAAFRVMESGPIAWLGI